VSRQENTIAGQDFTRFEKGDVTNDDFLEMEKLILISARARRKGKFRRAP
jgi:hypothetical protein